MKEISNMIIRQPHAHIHIHIKIILKKKKYYYYYYYKREREPGRDKEIKDVSFFLYQRWVWNIIRNIIERNSKRI